MCWSVVCPTYKELLQGSDINFVQDKVVAINLQEKRLKLASGSDYIYGHLVLAVGSIQGYLGIEGAQKNAFAFRTQENAIALERQLRECLQRASQTDDETQRRSLLTFAVVGAGPTGVEMAATLADLLPDWYAQLGSDIRQIRIVLINHGKTILAGDVNAGLQEEALQAFRTRTVPVELILGVGVKAVAQDHLEYQPANSTEIKTLLTQTTIWTAGTAVNPLIQNLKSQIPADHLDKHGLCWRILIAMMHIKRNYKQFEKPFGMLKKSLPASALAHAFCIPPDRNILRQAIEQIL